MTDIQVEVKVVIKSPSGAATEVKRTLVSHTGDNTRFYAGVTRTGLRFAEDQIMDLLKSQYGGKGMEDDAPSEWRG